MSEGVRIPFSVTPCVPDSEHNPFDAVSPDSTHLQWIPIVECPAHFPVEFVSRDHPPRHLVRLTFDSFRSL